MKTLSPWRIAKKNNTRAQNRRRRGSLLVDIMLGMTIIMSLVGLSAQYTGQQSEHTRQLQIATEHDALLRGARGLVTVKLGEVRRKVFADGGVSVYSMNDLSQQGLLPPGFDGGVLRRIYGKDMSLLVRAVRRNDTANPKATMTLAQMRDPSDPSRINPILIDGVTSNDEMDFEALLVSHGGTPIPRSAGGGIISRMESPFGGYMTTNTLASGSYGSLQINTTPFNALSQRPRQGDLASVVALSNFDVLAEGKLKDAFLRCEGLNTGSDDYQECLGNNRVYTDLILQHSDTDNNGTPDRFPALRGVTALDCAPDGTTTGTASQFRINCATTQMTGNLNVTGNTTVSGNSTVAGSISVAGKTNVVGPLRTTASRMNFEEKPFIERRNLGGVPNDVLTGDRVQMATMNGGQDLAEAVISSQVVRPEALVAKPQCPARTLDGAHAMRPRIYLSPIEYADPFGRPIVGVRAFAQDAGSNWRVKLMAIVAQDICTSNFNNPIPISAISNTPMQFSRPLYDYLGNPNGTHDFERYYPVHSQCHSWTSEGEPTTATAGRKDGLSDVYTLGANNAVVLAQTRCY